MGNFIQVVKNVDALIVFYLFFGFGAYAIMDSVFEIFKWGRKKWKNRKKRKDAAENIETDKQ